MAPWLPLRLTALIILLLVTLPAQGNWRNVEAVKTVIGDTEPETSGLSLDLPSVSEDGSNIAMTVSFDGELAEDAVLESIRVFAPGNPSPEVIAFHLTDAITRPDFRTRIRLAESQTVYATARSSDGRTWVTSREVRVTVSGCLMDNDQGREIRMANPRVALGDGARKGQPLAIRTMINHPMETGLRDGEDDPGIPEQLVESLQITQNGNTLFNVRFHSGTSENPYVMFHLTPRESGPLTIRWQDQQGDEVSIEESLSLR